MVVGIRCLGKRAVKDAAGADGVAHGGGWVQTAGMVQIGQDLQGVLD